MPVGSAGGMAGLCVLENPLCLLDGELMKNLITPWSLAWFVTFSACAAVASAPAPLVRTAPAFPDIVAAPDRAGATPQRYSVLRGDFHIHTPHSDGELTPRERVEEAWEYGYDVLAITDHRNFTAYAEALPVAEEFGLILIRGMETGLHGMEHLVALDFAADYVPRDPHSWADTEGESRVYYREQWRRLTDAGGFVLYAHPHVGLNGAGAWVAETGEPLDPPLRHRLREPIRWALAEGLLHGIEVRNHATDRGWGIVRDRGTLWYPMALDWADEYGLTVFANSDVHKSRAEDGNAHEPQSATLLLVRERSPEGVMEALRAGRTVAHFAGLLCGRKDTVATLVQGLTRVDLGSGPDGAGRVRIENLGPVALTAEFRGADLKPVTVDAHQTALVELAGAPEELSITWTNALIRSTDSLVTVHRRAP
jgi:hypothetical protein